MAIESPDIREIADACVNLGFDVHLEEEKFYSRDPMQRGRLKVKLFDGSRRPIKESIPKRAPSHRGSFSPVRQSH